MTNKTTSAIDLVDLWRRRHDLTKDEWLEAAPVLLGVSVANADTITRLQAALEPFARYVDLNDLKGRGDPDGAIEVPISDCLAAHDALSSVGGE